MLKIIYSIFYTESLLMLRRSHEWLYPLAFFCIIMCLFPLVFSPDPLFLQKYVPGCIWIAALFANLLSIQQVFLTDLEDGYVEQCLLNETPLSIWILTKFITHWLITQFPLVLLTPLIGLTFHLSAATITAIALSLLLGTPILTLIGGLMVALTLSLRQQGVMLGLLILPLVTPVLIFGVSIVQQAQNDFALLGPLAFLAGLTLLAISLLPWTIAAALRIGLDD